MGREFNFAELRESAEPMQSFRERRHNVMLKAQVTCDGTEPCTGRIRNISRGGLMCECRLRAREGERIEIALRGLGEVVGSVAWVGRDRIGVIFDEPVDPAAVLRRPAPAQPESFIPRAADRAWRPPLHCS